MKLKEVVASLAAAGNQQTRKIREAKLETLALKAAGRIGTVEVDHGDTACKTPDAAAFIEKAATRKKIKR